jgi:LysR family hydrogen peroxide-inducible transcriptional activator
MTLKELRYVVALACTRHFGQAAKMCFVTQSTLSTQLKKLEDSLGVALFDRSVKGVALTPVGQEIVESARRILEETDRIRELARHLEDPMDRAVHLGIIPTLGPYYLPHVLSAVRSNFPRLRLLLREEMTAQLLADLAEGRLDAGVVALPLPVDDAGLEVEPLFREPFLAAVPADHPLSAAEQIPVEDMVRAGLLLLEEGHCLRKQALDVCRLVDLEHEEVRATSLETLRQMVAMGQGVTLIPALACQTPSNCVALRPLAFPGASRAVGLAWRRRSPVAPTLKSLAQFLIGLLPPGILPYRRRSDARSVVSLHHQDAGLRPSRALKRNGSLELERSS